MSFPVYELKLDAELVSPKQPRLTRIPRYQSGQLFVKEPIPLPWLCAASQQPGRALSVGIAIWFLAGCTGKATVSLGNELCRSFGVDRFAKRRGLDALSSVGLIEVQHRRGRNPLVTLRNGFGSTPDDHSPPRL
jgi:hypothetical protein